MTDTTPTAKTMLELADELLSLADVEQSFGRNYNRDVIRRASAALRAFHQSAPPIRAPHKTGERVPSGDTARGGADTERLELAEDERVAMWHVINYVDQEIRHQNVVGPRDDVKLRLEKWLAEAVVKCLKVARTSAAAAQPVYYRYRTKAHGGDWNVVLPKDLPTDKSGWEVEPLYATPSPLSAPGLKAFKLAEGRP